MTDALLIGYNVHTEADRQRMLEDIGVGSVEELLEPIPSSVRLRRELDLPPPLNEWQLTRKFRKYASENETCETCSSWLGGGAYHHYIPEVVRSMASRGEFLTAYTPYQPEMSQGILRVLFDFQQLMAKILGQPAVNCSVYDGSTALAECAWMTCTAKKKSRILVASSLWPQYLDVLETYLRGRKVELVMLPSDPDTGELDSARAESLLESGDFAAFVVQSPNRFGVIENIAEICEVAHAADALALVSINPLLSGCFPPPGKEGADFVCCEAQPLGLELNAGGPYLGVIATRPEYEDYLPGRIVGICKDIKGEPAFALVKEEREQHVARHKATSHICSNQALLALRVATHLGVLGEEGLRRIAGLNVVKAHRLESRLTALPGVSRARSGEFFNEFLLDLPCRVPDLLARLRRERIFGGIDCSGWENEGGNRLLVAVTELKSAADIDDYVGHFSRALESIG